MRNFSLIFVLAAAVSLMIASCKTGKPRFEGVIKDANDMQIVLEQLQYNNTQRTVHRAKTDANGGFLLENPEPLPQGIYRLMVGAKPILMIFDGTEKTIKISGDLATFNQYDIKVEGSKTMTCYSEIMKDLSSRKTAINEQEVRAILGKSCNPLMSSLLVQQLGGQQTGAFKAEFASAATALTTYMPGTGYAKDFEGIVASIEKQANAAQSAGAIQLGSPAPDITLPGPDGKNRSLSDLKGKVVLLDFWASWCRPCRMANPHVVEVYKKYKEKGFTVFSVSLDRENGKQAWIDAIKQDGLEWDSHVSDLRHWNSAPAALYGVQGIPKTFLIDREGNLVAIDPRNNLEEAVKKAL